MHELSLAQGILEIVQQYVPGEQRRAVKSVKLKIGTQAGVVVDSLEFCFLAITARTDFEGAHLEIERVPFSFSCKSCGAVFEDDNGILHCPSCSGSSFTILSGTELRVTEIELYDHASEVT